MKSLRRIRFKSPPALTCTFLLTHHQLAWRSVLGLLSQTPFLVKTSFENESSVATSWTHHQTWEDFPDTSCQAENGTKPEVGSLQCLSAVRSLGRIFTTSSHDLTFSFHIAQ